MKGILAEGLMMTLLLFLAEKVRFRDTSPSSASVSLYCTQRYWANSSSLGRMHNTIGGYNSNDESEDETDPSYLGKDSTFKYSPHEEAITNILKSFGSCRAKHPLSDDEVTALEKQDMDIQFSHDAKCFFACMFKAADLLKDGRIVTENLMEYLNEESSGITNSREIIEYCNIEVSESEPDLCEYVYKMTKCWTKKILSS